MFSPPGARLPWKSFHARTCRSVVRSGLWLSAQETETWSERVRAPPMVTALAGAAPTTASGAVSTALSPVTIRPARTGRERSSLAVTPRRRGDVGIMESLHGSYARRCIFPRDPANHIDGE